MPHLKSLSNRRVALFAATALVAAATFATSASAAVPTSMVVEGFLNSTGGGAAADGVYDVTFEIYNVQSGGSAAWKEGPLKVAVKGGQFAHPLGASKALSAATLDKLNTAWLSLKIGADPALPRQRLRAVTYALLADTAKKLACSGCVGGGALAKGAVSANHVGFPFAGAKTKGGPATIALNLQCTGCVSVSELKIDKDLDLGGNALKAKAVAAATVSATTFQGDGSKLTGIKIPSGECKVAGEVVKGINPNGSLKCVKAMDSKALPPDGIDEISNFLIHNQFQNTDCMPNAVPIKDNNPIGVSAELSFGDYGQSQQLDVLIDLKNSDLKSITVKMWDPASTEYLLWDKTSSGNSLSGEWPSKTKLLKGDLTKWLGKNPKGKWRIQVIDTKFLNNGNDGAVNKFCVKSQTLSNKKIKIQGSLIVQGSITNSKGEDAFSGGPWVKPNTACNLANKGKMRDQDGHAQHCNGYTWSKLNGALYRYATWHSYGQWQGNWFADNRQELFGGRHPQQWGDGSARAYQMSSNADYMRTLYQRAGPAINSIPKNATVHARTWYGYSSTDSEHSSALFRIHNTTKSNINWRPYFYMTSFGGWGERASVTLNGGNNWESGGSNYNSSREFSVNLSIPANRTSTVIFIAGSTPTSGSYRTNLLAFYNNSLTLPNGLIYVDDLDWKPHGWNK